MKISVLISAHNREKELFRCLESIRSQFSMLPRDVEVEIVLVNDGSEDDTNAVIQKFNKDHLVCIQHTIRQERAISYGDAIEAATGDWMFHMGSDDVVYPGIFNYLALSIERHPEALLLNYGWAANNKHARMTVTPGTPFPPYEHFESGRVAAGSFCWHKSITSQICMPRAKNCYELADMAGIPGYSGSTRTLGNPWGEDYYIFWKLTRKNISIHLPLIGVVVNTR